MTRFLVTLPEAVDTVFYALKEMKGSEIFIEGLSIKMQTWQSIAPGVKMKIGIGLEKNCM